MSADTPKIQYKKEVEVRVRSYGETRSMNPTPKTLKMKESEEVQRDVSHDLQDWLQEFRENFVDKSTSTGPRGNLRIRIKTLPVLLTVSTRTFRRTQIAISA